MTDIFKINHNQKYWEKTDRIFILKKTNCCNIDSFHTASIIYSIVPTVLSVPESNKRPFFVQFLSTSAHLLWILKTHNRAGQVTATGTHNHLVRKRTLHHLAKSANLGKGLSVRLRTKWLWVRITLQSLKLQISRLFRARISLIFRQL